MAAWVDRIHRLRPLTLVYDASYVVRAGVRKYLQTEATNPSSAERVLMSGYVRKSFGAASGYVNPNRTGTMLPRVYHTLERLGIRLTLLRLNPKRGRLPLYDQIPVIDVRYPRTPEFRHEHDAHPNEAAHIEMAKQVFAHLSASPWFPKPSRAR